MEWIWLLTFTVLLAIEAITFNLLTVWFAVGALGAFFTTYVTSDVLLQCLVFIIVTSISLIVTRPLVRKLRKGNDPISTNLDAAIGKIGIVEEDITPHHLGRVYILGKNWAAKSDKTIKKGNKVKILAIEGVKLIVQKKEED